MRGMTDLGKRAVGAGKRFLICPGENASLKKKRAKAFFAYSEKIERETK